MVENDTNNWNKLASDIEATVNEASQRLRSLSNEIIVARPKSDDWSVKEIVGHLLDSASNNHQRFVRLQGENYLFLRSCLPRGEVHQVFFENKSAYFFS